MRNLEQRMLPAEFENAMERSFLFWLQNEIPEIVISDLSIPVEIVSCMPYEYYLKKRENCVVIDVAFADKRTEAFSIGGQISGDLADDIDPTAAVGRNAPWMYKMMLNINIYCGSAGERAKADGMLRYLFEGLRRGYKNCPVYEWMADTSAVSAYTTGTYINVMNNNDARSVHAEDQKNSDYLSHWTVYAKCLYVYDTTTELVSSFSLTAYPIISN